MSGVSQGDSTPDFLRTAVEYRDRLKAELARVDQFLGTAGRRPEAGSAEYPEFLLLGDDEVLESLLPHWPGSSGIH